MWEQIQKKTQDVLKSNAAVKAKVLLLSPQTHTLILNHDFVSGGSEIGSCETSWSGQGEQNS